MKKVYIGTHEYELHTRICTINANDDKDMPIISIFTARDLSQDEDPWLALCEEPEGEYSENCVGGFESEKELAIAIGQAWSAWSTVDWLEEESELFD